MTLLHSLSADVQCQDGTVIRQAVPVITNVTVCVCPLTFLLYIAYLCTFCVTARSAEYLDCYSRFCKMMPLFAIGNEIFLWNV